MNDTFLNLERRGLMALGVLGIAAHALLFFSGWATVASVLILAILLPGILAAAWLLRRVFPTWLEFSLYSLGLGYTLFILMTLALAALMGALVGWQVVVAMDLLSLLLAFGWWRAQAAPAHSPAHSPAMSSGWRAPDAVWDRWAVAGLLSVLLVGALLRLPNLGYSDFSIDEVRVMNASAEIIQGYPGVLLVHRKGPAEILIPTGIYAVQQSITEAQARLPFALASMASLVALYLLGWRLFGKVAGWAAAMLLAIEGLSVGFARFVQYQSVVIFVCILIVLAIHRYLQRPHGQRSQAAYLWIAGLCFVTGIYSHYDTIWVVVPGVYMLWLYGARTGNWRGLLRDATAPLLVTVGLILAFYVPFVLDANWSNTAEHLLRKRIGVGKPFPFNTLVDFYQRSAIYNSAYQFLFLVAVTVIAQLVVLWHAWPRWAAWLASAVTLIGLAVTFFVRPDWLRVGGADHTWFFFALLFGAVVFTPKLRHEDRAIWLWLAIPLLISIFAIEEPNTHVYVFYMGWFLIVANTIEQGWAALRGWRGVAVARRLALPVAALLIIIFGNYVFWNFVYTKVEIFRTWQENRLAGYWTPYDLPSRGSVFGVPYKNGWKTIGVLYADGTLDAPFDTYESERVTDWYSRGPYMCPPDAEYYLVSNKIQPNERSREQEKLDELEGIGYQKWGSVTYDGVERIRILSKDPVEGEPRVFDAADYEPIFDATLASPYFVKTGRALLVEPATSVDFRLGETVWLKGYTLSETQVVAGSKVHLDLFWEVSEYQQIEDSELGSDKSTVQLINLDTLHKAAQRDNQPGCAVYTMEEWRPGTLTYDPYTLSVAPDTPPGTYTVLVGLYGAKSQEHYPIFAPDDTYLGDTVQLTSIEVLAP